MGTKIRPVLTPGDIDETITPREIGGKAWQLWRLGRCSMTVPAWCVVTTEVFRRAIEPYRERIADLCSAIRAEDQDGIRRTAGAIGKLLGNLSLQKKDEAELDQAVYRLFGITGRLAVRSSAVGEDAVAHSFAGQMDSFLNVPPDRIAPMIINVWRSAFSERILLYRLQSGLDLESISVAVIIQQMVCAERSGVMFTRNPETMDSEILVEAVYGLGEGVVANHAETDSYRLGWSAWRTRRTIRTKRSRVAPSSAGDKLTDSVAVDPILQDKPVLSSGEVRELRATGIQLEQLFGAPQDVEFCYDSRGRLYILQSRPITPSRKSHGREAFRIWDNSNIVESYPGLTLPLTFSFICANYEMVFRNAACGLVRSERQLAARADIWKNMVGLIHGRVYYNLLNWYAMLSYLPGFNRHQKAWDQMIGIKRKTAIKAGRLPWYNRMYAIGAVLRQLLFVNRTTRQFGAQFTPLYARYRRFDFSRMSEPELIECYLTMERELMGFWHLTLYTDFCAMKYYDWLARLCRHYSGSESANLHSDLLCGESGIESVGPVRSVVSLAEQIRNNPLYRALFSRHSDADVWDKIALEVEYLPLREECLRYFDLYGDRCAEELKLETRTPREQPRQLIAVIRTYVKGDLTVAQLKSREQAKRLAAEDRLYEQMYNPITRLVVRTVMNKARTAVANRENMRFARTRAYGITRALFRRFGDLLAERKVIESPSDIAYLTIPELFGYVNGTTVTNDLSALVRLRKEQYEHFAQETLPDRFETTDPPALFVEQGESAWQTENGSLSGTGCSSGIVEGDAVVVRDPKNASIRPDQILVAESTDPSWVFLMLNSRGIVVERGSVLSHTAIIGRELGIPTIVGALKATRLIPCLARVRINGSTGEVVWR